MEEAERVAEEIMNLYTPFCIDKLQYDEEYISKAKLKKLCLIHVEGIIKVIKELSNHHERPLHRLTEVDYLEVKTIIENK